MKKAVSSSQAGFSLVELLVAMLVTLIVSGAVFGLMTAGQGAFRREPELTERQQNVRVAMDLITRDIQAAGVAMDPFEQVFTRSDAVNQANAPFLSARGPVGPGGDNSDFLQIIASVDCPTVPIADTDGVNVRTLIGFPDCYPEPGMVMVTFDDGRTNWGWGHNLHSGDNKDLNFPGGQRPPQGEIDGPADVDGATSVMPMQLVRYEIAPEPDGVPGLWRSDQGGLDVDGVYRAAPNPLGDWQLIARGIEDLQVFYRRADNVEMDVAPLVVVNDFNTIVREVRVVVTARAQAQNLQGQTAGANDARNFVRGSLTNITTPRQALLTLRNAPAGLTWQ
jgi:prepilin-type N-terminal cleavage/methylation domain-containing protein